jgi:chemotaxis signal transduction protein
MSGAERLARAVELRTDFDAAFARTPDPATPPQLDLLVIRVGEHRYALRLSEVLAVHADRKLVAVPSPRSDLLGLVGLRGVIAPVYDLRLLLGYPAAGTPRWLAHVRAAGPLAVAFELFEQHLRLPLADVMSASGSDGAAHRFVTGSAPSATGPLSIIDLPAVYQEVTSGTRRLTATEREGTS